MERSNSALAAAVNRAALASAAPRKRWLNNLIDTSGVLPALGPINPWRRPSPGDVGAKLATEGISTQIAVTLRADPTGRSIWLVLDQSEAAVVTGNCTIRFDPGTEGPVSTFAASSTPVGQVAQLWAEQIIEDYGNDFAVVVQSTKAADDTICIRVRHDEAGDPGGGSSFVVTQLTAPAALNLTLIREVEEVEAKLWARSAAIRSAGLRSARLADEHRAAWIEYPNVAFPTIGVGGCIKAAEDLASIDALWVQLSDRVLPVGETLTPATTGPGIRRILDFVGCSVAQQAPGGT